MVAKGHRLRGLHMRKTRHHCSGFFSRQIHQGRLQCMRHRQNIINRITQVQANIGRHLVIARASRMQFFARVTDALG